MRRFKLLGLFLFDFFIFSLWTFARVPILPGLLTVPGIVLGTFYLLSPVPLTAYSFSTWISMLIIMVIITGAYLFVIHPRYVRAMKEWHFELVNKIESLAA